MSIPKPVTPTVITPSEVLREAAENLDQYPGGKLEQQQVDNLSYAAFIINSAHAKYLETIAEDSNLSTDQMETIQNISKNVCLLGDPYHQSPDYRRENLDYIDLRISYLFARRLAELFETEGR